MFNQIIKDMKERMKTHPVTKEYLDKMKEEGIPEEEALDLMIYAWLNHNRWKQ